MRGTPNVQLCTVEAAYGDRHHEVTSASDPFALQLRTNSEIWIKENMINLGFRHLLPRDWKYAAWIDADVFFRDPGWALETIHQLQHFSVVQPWSDCLDLGHLGNVIQHFRSFGSQHQKRRPKYRWPGDPYEYAHSGFAWACTRAFFENLPGAGLADFGILGSGDHHMAFGMIGEILSTIHKEMPSSFFRLCKEWELKATQITHGEVGFVPGRIEHKWHGSKKKRYYRERWQILIDHGFDPDKHLMYDNQGLIQLRGLPRLEQAIHMYNLSRQEDGIDD
jgi:hypothetical protein